MNIVIPQAHYNEFPGEINNYGGNHVEPEGLCGGHNDPCYSGIQEAINGVFESGKIKVGGGSYDENIVLDKAGVRPDFAWDSSFSNLSHSAPAVLRRPTPP